MRTPAFWRNLSVSKKLYIVVGVMGLLIAFELFTLRFAMNTLSAVRGFVGGEGLWSKAQKTSVVNLQKYAFTRDVIYYEAFKKSLEIPLGDRQAKIELEKQHPDYKLLFEGFEQGEIHKEDIPGLVNLVRRFHWVPHLNRALMIWDDGNRGLTRLMELGEALHQDILANKPEAEIRATLSRIDEIDAELTVIEKNFSMTLGEGSRWLENLLMNILLLAVLMVESTGLLLTISFSRNLSRGLRELAEATQCVARGEFNQRIPVRSRDELGQLADALNTMTSELEANIGTRQQAEHASRAKSMFLANMSHEIRTPLAAILGFTDLLRSPDVTDEERHKYVEIIHRTGTALSQIINDILDLSKVEAGRIEVEKNDFSLTRLLNDMQQVLAVRGAEKAIEISFNPIGDVPVKIYSDPLRLRQILMNVLGNAVKFTETGSVRLNYTTKDSNLVFTVQDTGIGMSGDQAKRLFRAFSQADSSTVRKYQGSGLGLVLSRQLARLLGGDVTLEHTVQGQGSTFSIRIPFEVRGDVNPQARDFADEKELSQRLNGKNILVVEDSLDNQLLIEIILAKRGVRVEFANNGKEGVDKALKGNHDLVIMDVQMPVMDGYTAVRQLRSHDYHKPIIALTAHAMKEDRDRCLEAGYSEYLTKPIQTNEFLQTVSQYMTPA